MSLPGRSGRPGERRTGRWLPAEVRWWLGRHRRPLAAALAALAVWASLSAATARPGAGVAVLAAGRDLAAGTALAPADLRTVRLPRSAVPAGALLPGDAVTGRVLSGPLRRGEPLTDVRLAITLLLPPGTEAVPLRLSDAGAAAMVSAGDHIDVLAAAGFATAAAGAGTGGTGTAGTGGEGAGSSPPSAIRVAAGLVVLSAPAASAAGSGLLGASGSDSSSGEGALLVVAATASQASALAGAAAVDQLSVALVAPAATTHGVTGAR